MTGGYTVEEFLADMFNAGIEGTFDFLYWPRGHLIANSILHDTCPSKECVNNLMLNLR